MDTPQIGDKVVFTEKGWRRHGKEPGLYPGKSEINSGDAVGIVRGIIRPYTTRFEVEFIGRYGLLRYHCFYCPDAMFTEFMLCERQAEPVNDPARYDRDLFGGA